MASPTTATSTAPAAVAAATTTAAPVAAKTAAPAGVASAATTMAPAPKADAPAAEPKKEGAEQPKKEGIIAKVTGFFGGIFSGIYSFLKAIFCCNCCGKSPDEIKKDQLEQAAKEAKTAADEQVKKDQAVAAKAAEDLAKAVKEAEAARVAHKHLWNPATWDIFNAPISAENFKPTAKVEIK
ncbi:MAG: hypothetical protein HZB76_03250 [Chlamydiae bacterium]|nr:hypothetical protein [Chlamydiota bacterium]